MPTPLLLFSDSVSASSGLARITRDIALHIHHHLADQFKLATIGYGAAGSSKLPWQQYHWANNDEWIIHDLPEIWDDFAGEETGVFMSVQDPSRMIWFAQPQTCSDQRVAKFLMSNPFEKWGYFPIDATGPNGRLSVMLGKCVEGYDRALAYTKWAKDILVNTLGVHACKDRDVTNLPHGFDASVFYPRGRFDTRRMFGLMTVGQDIKIDDKELLIGIIATNQARKDYGQAIAAVAELARRRKVRLWIHTDAADRYWSIPYLLTDYNLPGAIMTLQTFNDDVMAKLYSACDVTLGIGLGEGWGFPLVESLACGTPCVHGNYGGGREIVPSELRVPVLYYRTEGLYGCQRPVFQTTDWIHCIEKAVEFDRESCPQLVAKYDWNACWPDWEKWLRKGVSSETAEKQCQSQTV